VPDASDFCGERLLLAYFGTVCKWTSRPSHPLPLQLQIPRTQASPSGTTSVVIEKQDGLFGSGACFVTLEFPFLVVILSAGGPTIRSDGSTHTWCCRVAESLQLGVASYNVTTTSFPDVPVLAAHSHTRASSICFTRIFLALVRSAACGGRQRDGVDCHAKGLDQARLSGGNWGRSTSIDGGVFGG
jgi:hypothetical protein